MIINPTEYNEKGLSCIKLVILGMKDIRAVLPSLCIFLLQLKKIGIYDPPVGVLLDKKQLFFWLILKI